MNKSELDSVCALGLIIEDIKPHVPKCCNTLILQAELIVKHIKDSNFELLATPPPIIISKDSNVKLIGTIKQGKGRQ